MAGGRSQASAAPQAVEAGERKEENGGTQKVCETDSMCAEAFRWKLRLGDLLSLVPQQSSFLAFASAWRRSRISVAVS